MVKCDACAEALHTRAVVCLTRDVTAHTHTHAHTETHETSHLRHTHMQSCIPQLILKT